MEKLKWLSREDMENAPDIEVNCSQCQKRFFVRYRTAYERQNKNWKYICKKCESKNALMIHPRKRTVPTHIDVNCSICGNKFEKTYIAYQRNIKDNIPHICRTCLPLYIGNKRKSEWDELSESDRQNKINKLNIGNKKYWEAITEEDLDILKKQRSKTSKQRIQNMSTKEYFKMLQCLFDGHKKWRDNMSPEEFREWNNRRIETFEKHKYSLNKLEKEFFNTLTNIGCSNITTRWYNKIKHKDFDKLFPYNPYLQTKNIIPFHEWDFKVLVGSKEILIDVDGSIHKSTNKISIQGIDVASYIQFNDSQRPYQTDGLDAYIIMAYDNKLYDDTAVYSINNNCNINLKSLLNILVDKVV